MNAVSTTSSTTVSTISSTTSPTSLTYPTFYKYDIKFLLSFKNYGTLVDEKISEELKKKNIFLFEIIYPNRKKKGIMRENIVMKMEEIVHIENAWKPDILLQNDTKKIKGIINKLTNDNLNKLTIQVLELNYEDPDIINMIFKKAVDDPKFSKEYATFCSKLPLLHKLLKEICISHFASEKNKNLCRFIGELYNFNLIADLEEFTSILLENLDEKNLEMLCELIRTVGHEKEEFVDIIAHLEKIKKDFGKLRCEVLIDTLRD